MKENNKENTARIYINEKETNNKKENINNSNISKKTKNTNKKTPKNKKNKKKKKQSKVSIVFLWILTLIVGLLCIAVVFSLTHPFFNIQTINITGNVVNPRKTVESVLEFEEGSNLFLAKKKKTAENIMELPDVVEVRIKTVIPSRIDVIIKEDFDLGYIEKNDKFYVVDGNGNIKELTHTDTENLIEIRGIDKNEISEGENISSQEEVKIILDQIKKQGLFRDIEFIDFADEDNITLKTRNGIDIHLGSKKDSDKKIATLSKMLKEINVKKIDAKEILLNLGKNPVIVTNNGESTLPENYNIDENTDTTEETENKDKENTKENKNKDSIKENNNGTLG